MRRLASKIVYSQLIVLTLVFALGCEEEENETQEEEKTFPQDSRTGESYYSLRINDSTVDALAMATPGMDIDAVELIKADAGISHYANRVYTYDIGPGEIYPGLEKPDNALGEPDYPEGDCPAFEVKFFGAGGPDAHIVLGFGEAVIEPGDTIRVYECENGHETSPEFYDLAVGSATDPSSDSFVSIGENTWGIKDFIVPETLPPLN